MIQYISTTLDGTTTSVTGNPFPLAKDDYRSVTFQYHVNDDGTGTLDAAWAVEISNDPAAYGDMVNGTTNADWTDITSDLTITDVTTGEEEGVISISFLGSAFVRVKLTRNSGTGAVTVYAQGIDGAR